MPTVQFAPAVRGRRDSVTALLAACTEDRRRQSVTEIKRRLSTVDRRRESVADVKRKLSAIQEATERKLSGLPDYAGPGVGVRSRALSAVDDVLDENEELLQDSSTRSGRRSSVQGFIDKIDLVSEAVAQLEEKIAQLEAIYQQAPLNDDKAYMEYVLSKKQEHHDLERESEKFCRSIRHQIQDIKVDVQNAGKSGILNMDPAIRRTQYNTFVKSLTRMMERYLDSEIHFVHWEKTIDRLQKSRRSSVIEVYGWNTEQASNLEKIEEELSDIKKLGSQLHDLTRSFEDLANLVEGQADLLDRIDELDRGSAVSPLAPVLTADELEDKLLEEERLQRRTDLKTLAKFAVFGFVLFVLLMLVILQNGKFCYGDDDPTSPYSCKNIIRPHKNHTDSQAQHH